MNYDIQCYLRKDDGASQTVNTRDMFPGMYVLEANGLADYGKAKNIVTESYAEGPGVNAYVPDDIAREATDVTLKLLFLDTNGYGRYQQYDDFIAYVENAVCWYWDSVRGRAARLLLTEKSSPKENFHGSVEYIEADVKFKNIDGFPTPADFWRYEWTGGICQRVDGSQNGYARFRDCVFTNGTETQTAHFEEAFGDFDAIDNDELATMSDSDYNTRLAAFSRYHVDDMETAVERFFIRDITSGASVFNPEICPLD